jgi:putative endonuclease
MVETALMTSTWFLYVLECRDGSLYTGITVNVEKRFTAHVAGKGARYTRAHKPERILATQSFPDRSAASKAEYALKQLTVEQKRAFCRSHAYKEHLAE